MATRISYWSLLRVIFVLCSLYLIGDAFLRWDGFSYYASFTEFLPSVALISVLWSIIAVFISFMVWIVLRILQWLCDRSGFGIRIEHILLYAGIFILLGALSWEGKKIIWSNLETSKETKLIVLMCVVSISALLAVIFRKKAQQCIDYIQVSITPLVWLFGVIVLCSVSVVLYYAQWQKADNVLLQRIESASGSDIKKPNIILVSFDALTARDMSLYGYNRETTPFISEWAKKATMYTEVKSESNFTTSATASMMTGKRVWTHQTYHIEGRPVKSSSESLPALLKRNGYTTMAFVVNQHTSVKTLGMSQSFDIAPLASEFGISHSLFGWKFGHVEVVLYKLFGNQMRLYNWILQRDFILNKIFDLISRNFRHTEVPPQKTFNKFLEIVDRNSGRPYFAWIHIFPPHDPYLLPESYKSVFSSSRELRTFKSQEEIRLKSFKYLFNYEPVPEEMMPSIKLLRAYYNDFIRFCDNKFQEFIIQLEERNELENTIVILTADHGESFEHGYFTHGGPFLYEQVTHIPLIIKQPGQIRGQVVNDLVEQIDIPATILDLVDIQVPSWMEGRSLAPLMQGKGLPQRPAFSMNFEENRSRGHQITKGSIAVWDGNYKLIHYLGKNESLLFNLKDDPDELDNLFDKEPETAQDLLKVLLNNLELANENIRNGK